MRAKSRLEFHVSVDDPESGISELSFGFDQDDDKLLSKLEIRGTIHFDQPLLRSQLVESLQIPADKLPEKDGRYRLLVQAKNGLRQPCKELGSCLIEITYPIK